MWYVEVILTKLQYYNTAFVVVSMPHYVCVPAFGYLSAA